MGGKQETLLGLSGVGDIMLTCGSEKSRNMSLGIAIGKGKRLDELLKAHKTVEGIATSKSVSMLAEKLNLEMPITNAVKSILHDSASVRETVQKLLERPFTVEAGYTEN
jgi:glycerol-3-phosphate dehydrogenase (NAD(P)+)